MNYLIIRKTDENPAEVYRIAEVFNNRELRLLAEFIEDALDRDIYEPGQLTAKIFLRLLERWDE